MQSKPNDRVFNLTKPQANFILSEKRYPAFVGGWGTGKSTALIAKAMYLSETYPNNLGVIFRKEYTDLRDSTVRDFENYTGLKVSSEGAVKLGNKSEILFRHMEQMNNIQNLNLGWFGVEQAEEFDSDEEFFKLHGRLRRDACQRTGFIIANTNGHNWIFNLWKLGKDADYPLFESSAVDVAGYIPKDTLESWEKLKESKPKIYNRFVLNSWEESDTVDIIVPSDRVEAAKKRDVGLGFPIRRVVAVDVARYGDDKTVFYAIEGCPRFRRVMAKEVHEKKSTMETVGLAQLFAKKHGHIQTFAVDEIGVGSGVVDRLRELDRHVIPINSAERSMVPTGFYNRRAEMWGTAGQMFEDGLVQVLPDDKEGNEELSWMKFKAVKSNGEYQVEAKDEVKKRFGRSPDNADALVYGLWAVRNAKPSGEPDKYERHGKTETRSAVAVLG